MNTDYVSVKSSIETLKSISEALGIPEIAQNVYVLEQYISELQKKIEETK